MLGLEDVEQVVASNEVAMEAANPTERANRSAKRRINRGSLPKHLPRIEMVVDIEDHSCPCCGKPLHRIGEHTGERLDIVPAQFRVLLVRRPKYGCRACENVVVQAPAPARLIEGGLPTEATVAQVLFAKYADDLSLYRQSQIYARQGVALDLRGVQRPPAETMLAIKTIRVIDSRKNRHRRFCLASSIRPK